MEFYDMVLVLWLNHNISKQVLPKYINSAVLVE